MKKAVIVGGANGIGLSLALNMKGYDLIHIIDKQTPDIALPSYIEYTQFDLCSADYSLFDNFLDANTLIITAGFGRLSLFADLQEQEVIDSFMVNSIGVIRVIKCFYDKILEQDDFYCAVMGSIAGLLSSPLFSIYGATKAALCKFIESVNVELEKSGTSNRILNVSPGNIKGTKFSNGDNNLDLTKSLALEIIQQMKEKNDLYIPDFETTYKNVLERYHADFRTFGSESYDYKQDRNLRQK